jgi:signal peptidase II
MPSAKYHNARLWLILLVLGTTISCDRMTKAIASTTLKDVPVKSYLYDTLRLQYAENEGAFLGLGASLDSRSRFWVFTVGNASLLLIVALLLWRRESHRIRDTLGLSLILAGGVSNLFDRVFLGGRVVDFLNIGFGPLRTGIFNVADVAIMAGVAALLLRVPGTLRQS